MKKQPPPLHSPDRPTLTQLAHEAGEAADIALGSAKIAKQAAESIPKPDPRDDVNVKRLAGLERSEERRVGKECRL